MDRDGFRKCLRKEGKSPRVTEAVVGHIKEFEHPERLKTHMAEFVIRTEFEGIAPLPKEVKFTIDSAKRLPRLVEY